MIKDDTRPLALCDITSTQSSYQLLS